MEKLYKVSSNDMTNVDSLSNLLLLKIYDKTISDEDYACKEEMDNVLLYAKTHQNKVMKKDYAKFLNWSSLYASHRDEVNTLKNNC